MPMEGAWLPAGMLPMGMLMWYGMPGMGIMGRGPIIMPACTEWPVSHLNKHFALPTPGAKGISITNLSHHKPPIYASSALRAGGQLMCCFLLPFARRPQQLKVGPATLREDSEAKLTSGRHPLALHLLEHGHLLLQEVVEQHYLVLQL